MQHLSRVFQVLPPQPRDPTREITTIAHQLVYGILPACSCLRVGPLLLCNDSISEQSPQRYAVFIVEDECGFQIGHLDAVEIDCIDFSETCAKDAQHHLATLLRQAQAQTYDNRAVVHLRLEHKRHTCPLCA